MAANSSSSSVPFFSVSNDQYSAQQQQQQMMLLQQPQPPQPPPLQQPEPSSSAAGQPPSAAPQKKKRNLPGNPNPDAEVIALSPKSLLATNRFICEVCNKGFQREQNLQLHRRGHNLPWKLKQKNPKEVRRRVYLCPEPTCVHHDPSRALGDLTGIKKHFSRKHGEKKWKCDKCSKRYAVQSDWKAHSKTCGTREYRCDCGTLFSRRDSFITHRAFCDALAQESARLPSGISGIGGHLYGNSSSSINLGLPPVNSQLYSLQEHARSSSDLLRLRGATTGAAAQFDQLNASFRQPQPPPQSSPFYLGAAAGGASSQEFNEEHQQLLQSKPFHGLMHLPDLQANSNAPASSSAAAAANLFNLGFFSNAMNTSNINAGNQSGNLLIHDQFSNPSASAEATSLFSGNLMSNMYNSSADNQTPVMPQMSATALLQKAAQMDATSSGGGGGGGTGSSILRGFGSAYSNGKQADYRSSFAEVGGGESSRTPVESQSHFQDLMNSLANGSTVMFSGGNEQAAGFGNFNRGMPAMDGGKLHRNLSAGSSGGGGGGMGGSDRLTRDFLGVGSMLRISQRDQQLGINIGTLDPEMKSASTLSRSFGGTGGLQ